MLWLEEKGGIRYRVNSNEHRLNHDSISERKVMGLLLSTNGDACLRFPFIMIIQNAFGPREAL